MIVIKIPHFRTVFNSAVEHQKEIKFDKEMHTVQQALNVKTNTALCFVSEVIPVSKKKIKFILK